MCRCFQQWSVEHSHTHRPGSGRPRNTDACQERRILRATMAARTASREEIRAHVATAVSTKTTGNRLLEAGLRLGVPLARLLLKPRYRQARLLCCRESVDWRVEWRSVFFSDESRFCLYASDGRRSVRCIPGERHLPECIRPRHTGPTSGFMGWGPSVTTHGHIKCFCRVK